MILFRLLLLFSIATTTQLIASERVTLFYADITVHADATMTVRETIIVQSAQQKIRHGIIRDFPTIYTNAWGIRYVVPFEIVSVIVDQMPATYHLESYANGVSLRIGNQHKKLTQGQHSFVITYRTNRQLGFFDKHDELYWNVTGNGWEFPIDEVQAIVRFPSGAYVLSTHGYTGYQGMRGADYLAHQHEQTCYFSSTRTLSPREGLTLVATCNKGVITQPSCTKKIGWFLWDNLYLGVALLCLLSIVFIFMVAYRRYRSANKPGTIIPYFEPPQGLTPASVGYMQSFGFKDRFLSADLVNLAVRGFLTIELIKDVYTLKRTEAVPETGSYDATLLEKIFGDQPSITVSRQHQPAWAQALSCAHMHTIIQVGHHITEQQLLLWVNCGISLSCLIIEDIFFSHSLYYPVFLICGAVAGAFLGGMYAVRYCYTTQGRRLQDEIDGFKMFLSVTEQERMYLIGTPPTQTPELYERYLPYAMVLGVEKQWEAQFAPLFERLKAEGHPYVPRWGLYNYYWLHNFTRSINQAYPGSSTIPSAKSFPGSSSGSGGGGSSGGGGGGGGGRGW